MRRKIEPIGAKRFTYTLDHMGLATLASIEILEIAQMNRNRYMLSQEHNAIASKGLEIT